MKKIFKSKKFYKSESGLQDVIFLVGIFLFISILIIGLFPGKNMRTAVSQEFFIYSVMTVPVLAALYFIVISFQRSFYTDGAFIGSSIRKKMALAFVFVAILPSLPIVITSNFLLNQTLSNLIFDKTSNVLSQAIDMSNEPLRLMSDQISRELDVLRHKIQRGAIAPGSWESRNALRDVYKIKGFSVLFYNLEKFDGDNRIRAIDYYNVDFEKGLKDFYRVADFSTDKRVDKLSISGKDYLAGAFLYNYYLIVISKNISGEIAAQYAVYSQSLEDHKRLVYLLNKFKGNAGLYFFGISIVVILISILVSLYLSKNIVKPVLELSDAAKDLASGNFDVKLQRESEDELGHLFSSFNQMVNELNKNRKIMYQKQRLEAWKSMARRVVHEIKNPLTPIRLSAERMRKRYQENHPDIENIILTGTETIIEEVHVLMNILSEFTKFARLPEMKPQKTHINPIIENCVHIFSAHENIEFIVELDDKIPEIYIDKGLIRQTITNLLQNAVDAIQDIGKIQISSRFEVNRGSGIVRISIRDNGIGIREVDRDRIFNPGYSTKSTGSGLGLAIVGKIIMEHGGEISCNSEYGKGTEFFIDLPIDNIEDKHYVEDTDS